MPPSSSGGVGGERRGPDDSNELLTPRDNNGKKAASETATPPSRTRARAAAEKQQAATKDPTPPPPSHTPPPPPNVLALANPSIPDPTSRRWPSGRRPAAVACGRGLHGRGLFALEPIPAGAFVADYLGELVRGPLADVREAAYGFADGGTYMFRVDVDEEDDDDEEEEEGKEKEKEKGTAVAGSASKNIISSSLFQLPPPPFSGVPVVVDATQTGGAARFINHSCDPNCSTKAHADGGWVVEEEEEEVVLDDAPLGTTRTAGTARTTRTKRKVNLRLPRVGVVAKRDIAAGEELTYDYQFEPEPDEPAIGCHCGARGCRGRLN